MGWGKGYTFNLDRTGWRCQKGEASQMKKGSGGQVISHLSSALDRADKV